MKRQTIEIIENWILTGKTGKIITNFFKGGITAVQEEETHKTIKILTKPKEKDRL